MNEFPELISLLHGGSSLDATQIEDAVATLVDASVPDSLKAEFLKAFRVKGETAEEIASFVRALLRRAVNPEIDPTKLGGPLLDVCGTGGDRMDLFNVSTTAMFLLAAGGAVVIKHGNRGITSKCGGADVLEALGVKIHLAPEALKRCVAAHGLGFMFAPDYHPAFKAISPVRKMLAALGMTTIFNILGPLLNPARPDHQLVGVFAASSLQKFAETFLLLGRTHAWAVHGASETGLGVDEISTMGKTDVCKVSERGIEFEKIGPEQFGIARARAEELLGGNCEQNARVLRGILAGEIRGAKRDLVLLNAGAGFAVSNLAHDIHAGIELARAQIENGRALAKLEALQNFS